MNRTNNYIYTMHTFTLPGYGKEKMMLHKLPIDYHKYNELVR